MISYQSCLKRAEKEFLNPKFDEKFIKYSDFSININFVTSGNYKGENTNFIVYQSKIENIGCWINIVYRYHNKKVVAYYKGDHEDNKESEEFKRYMQEKGYTKGFEESISKLGLNEKEPNQNVKGLFDYFYKMIEEAEKEGLIDKDTVIIEATSGNTGIGLAMICAVKNYKLKIVMPDTMSVERIQLMRAYGTEVILTDGSLGMKACLEKLEELKKQEKKYFIPNQFTNVNNPKAHYETTAEEILKDMNNKVDVYICGTGTGGSFSGTAKKLKEKLPNIKTFPVEPASSPLLSKGYIGPHKIQGMGMSIGGIPVVYDGSLADGILVCEDDEAFKMMRELSFKEGILGGISTGATFKAALDYSKENANKGLRIVVLSTDSGEKYLSSSHGL